MSVVSLSVLVPAYNEEKTIQRVLGQLLEIRRIKEIIVIDDCSTDSTAKKVRSVKSKKIIYLKQEKNQGKGKAIQRGLRKVTGSHVLIQDADLEYSPFDIPTLLDPILSGRADIVFGSRFIGARTNMFYWHFLGNKMLNFIINILFDTILSDMETCYKIIPTKIMRELRLEENDFRIEPEITCKLLLLKKKIMEVPISYVGRTYEEGKKITWKDGIYALQTIISLRMKGFSV
ncbi:MAG: Glycosyl transferase family 2 [Microgenomates group bacterium GW2011_GWF2_45_18]|nr:MAG: Glycosyl transferase family 2 [Microgenomates group bacterium GW2011_GWF1_44_10]KKU02279.1 MAG: Glycosyl transferase family 2 [Microgenomates group bacterium GW2011_GWF2_45_18]OGJ41414.1 MAG: hypothetical protein A2378_00820 [Candidatus Pacebacteria bacterium RIFOXYB1_FULL_44_10]HAU99256.1 glycosyl transferase [Candidatus Paceibacterota bacterium]HAX01787.1 glycosyl transferase [Candidatus Paceibacterota bacterium]